MTIDHRKVVALATNETPFVKRVDDIDDYQVTTTVTRYTKSVWLTDRFKAAALDLNFAYNKSLADSITGNNLVTFTRASSGTYVGADGLIKTTPVNLAKNSEDFSTGRNNASFGVLSTVNTDQIAAPNGTTTADEIVTVTTTQQNRVANPHSVISGKNYTYSVFIKYNNTDTVEFYLGFTNRINGKGTFVFSTETATVSGATGLSAGFDKLSDGWYRFYFTATAFSTGSTNSGFIGGTAGGEKVYVWGEQIEEGSSPSDYIPTGATISGAPRFDHINTTPVNLVTYSEQLDQWIAGNNTTVTANAATAPDGTNTADRLVFPQQNSTFVSSNSFITSGKTYTASVYVKAVTPGTNDQFTFSFGGQSANNATSPFTATGEWQRFTATMTPTLSGGPNPFVVNNEGDGFTSDIYVWGVQVEEGSVAHDYIPTTNTGAVAAVTTVESLGLLIEEAKTNILLKSEKMNEWIVGNGSSVTANQAVAPDGTYTADRVQHGSGGSSWIRQDVLTPGTTYTASVYAKAVTPGTNDRFTIDLGSFPTLGDFVATDKWQRFSFTFTAGNNRFYLNNGDDSFSTDVYFWGAQVEEGNFATSYIATDSSTVTRAADLAEIAGTNFSSFYNQSAGTFFGDITGPGGFGFVAHDGSNNNRHGFGPTQGQSFTVISGVSTNFGVPPTPVVGGGKVAHAYKANDYGAFGNGANLPATSPTTVPIGVNQLALGYRGSFLANAFLNGHIKRLAYFSTRLGDNILQAITS